MRLWILYKNGIGFSRVIAEMLQDQLEDYIDVDVGMVKKIDPAFLFEEKFHYLIIGDNISKEIPSLEVQDWLFKYWELSKNKKARNIIASKVSFCDSKSTWLIFLLRSFRH